MGHVRLGFLPQTRPWKEVVRLISEGANVEAVAGATLHAADKAFATIQKDAGFADTVDLLTQLAVAAKKPDPAGHLAAQGLALSPESSIAEVADAIQRSLESKARERKSHSDFAELSHNALVSAVTTHLTTSLGPLFTPTSAEVHRALSTLGRPRHFGQLAQTFFDHLSRSCLNVFLSKTLGSQIGAGHQFSTTAQVSQFEGAMAQHTREASEIVARYCNEWFSKNLFEGNGAISKKKATGFGWVALQKIRSEMKERAKPDAR